MRVAIVVLSILLAAIPMQAGSVIVNPSQWVNLASTGGFLIDVTYRVGVESMETVRSYRDYFYFPISALPGPLSGATFEMYTGAITQNYVTVYVRQATDLSFAGVAGGPIFATHEFIQSESGGIYSFALNSNALSAITAAQGTGIAMGVYSTMASDHLVFGGTDGTETKRLVLSYTDPAVPEPGTFVLLGLGLAGLAGAALRRR